MAKKLWLPRMPMPKPSRPMKVRKDTIPRKQKHKRKVPNEDS